jgi:hypothetical protein
MKVIRWIALCSVIITGSAEAQLIVDAGGVRNLFYTVGGNDKGGLDGFHANLETGSKSAGVTYFGYPTRLLENTLLGADVKVTALDGLDELIKFDRWPQIQTTLLANKTWAPMIDRDHALIQSLTFRVAGLFTQYALFDTNQPAGAEFSKPDSFGGSLAATYSFAFPWFPGAVGLSFGVNATNNYASLPKVTIGTLRGSESSGGTTTGIVSGGKMAREGSLNYYHSFPVTIIYSHTFGQPELSDFLKNFHVWKYYPLEHGPNVSYNVIISPYGSFVPADEGKPTHSIGANLVLRKYKKAKESADPAEEKGEVSFPVALFVERQNTFSGKPNTTVGAALTYHFP